MTKRSQRTDRRKLAKLMIELMTEGGESTVRTEDGRDALAVLLGRRGGLKGGKARAEKLSPQVRREIAVRAAAARWGRK